MLKHREFPVFFIFQKTFILYINKNSPQEKVMKIYAKSALSKKQIDPKIEAGCDGIEIQLLSELCDGLSNKCLPANQAFDLNSMTHYPITVIHSPIYSLVNGREFYDLPLETMCANNQYQDLLNQVFFLASFYGKINDRNTIIVFHSASDFGFMRGTGDMYKYILENLDKMLYKYSHTEVAIENVSPIAPSLYSGLCFRNNFDCDNIVVADYLCRELKTKRVGTVLDTCHAQLARKYIGAVERELNDPNYTFGDLSDETFFEYNAPYCKLIHLSTFKNSGYGKKNHGTPYTMNDKKELKELMQLYQKYGYSVPITLEVYEDDYKTATNYSIEKETLLAVNKELGL
jgi:hypothetical protein